MKRREVITLLGGAAAAWPLGARAQQSGKVARIGFLSGASPNTAGYPNRVAALRSGLRDHGYVEGANLVIEYRWAEENYARLPALAAGHTNLIRIASSLRADMIFGKDSRDTQAFGSLS